MTLNQTIQRLKTLAESHSQVQTFVFDDILRVLDQKDITYPAIVCDLQNTVISDTENQTRHTLDVWVMDLENIADNSRANVFELYSDLLEIAQDYIAMIKSYNFQDTWTVGSPSPVSYFEEKLEDLVVAVKFSIEIGTDYLADRCQVPTNNPGLF